MRDVRLKRPIAGTQIIFRDFDLGFRRHPKTGKLVIKKNHESVQQALKYLVLSNKYERPFSPEYGTDLRNSLFENFDPFSAQRFTNDIESSIKAFEPRVSIDDDGNGQGVFIEQKDDENGLIVTIRYTNNVTTEITDLNVNLNRVR